MQKLTGIDMFRLDGERALITGGGTGIGFAIAQCFAAAGARVTITGRRGEILRQAALKLGEGTEYRVHDVTDTKSVPDLIHSLEAEGGITILVNNAGIHLKKKAVETTEDEFRLVMETHVLGSFALSRAVSPGMVERKSGSIIFIASMASLFGIPQVVAYSAAKSAYWGLIRTLAVELSPDNVRVNGIAPGWIETDLMRKAVEGDPDRRMKILGRTPMGRFGSVEDVGWAAVYLASRAARFVTGVMLPVDGGISIGF